MAVFREIESDSGLVLHHMIGVVSPVSPCRRWGHSSRSGCGIWRWSWRRERLVFLRVVRRISIVKVCRGHVRMLCETLLVCIGARNGAWWVRVEVAAGCVRWRRRPLRIVGVMRSVLDGILVTSAISLPIPTVPVSLSAIPRPCIPVSFSFFPISRPFSRPFSAPFPGPRLSLLLFLFSISILLQPNRCSARCSSTSGHIPEATSTPSPLFLLLLLLIMHSIIV